MKNEVKALGQLIINDQKLQNDYDMLNKWMVNYIAEQMHKYDCSAMEDEKQASGERCVDAIMKFWQQRYYNSRWNPFEKLRNLLEALEKAVYRESDIEFIEYMRNYKPEYCDSMQEQVKMVKKVISWLIEEMVENALDEVKEEEDDWVKIINDLNDGDGRIIRLITNISQGHKNMGVQMIEERIARIEDVIGLLSKLLESEREKMASK